MCRRRATQDRSIDFGTVLAANFDWRMGDSCINVSLPERESERLFGKPPTHRLISGWVLQFRLTRTRKCLVDPAPPHSNRVSMLPKPGRGWRELRNDWLYDFFGGCVNDLCG